MKAFVTGATGVVGGSLAAHLLEAGDLVTAYVRRPAQVPGADVVVGSLLSHRQLHNAMQGHDVVYHVAGVNELCTTDAQRMYQVNVDGTRAVLAAAGAAGVSRVVHTSSVAVAANPGSSHYARSKLLAEHAALAQADVETVVVRPASVQGPGRITGSARLIVDILTGRLSYAVDTVVSIVDIEDCSLGHRAAAVAGEAGGVYTLSGFTMSTREAFDTVETILGRPVTVRYLPVELLAVVAPFFEVTRLWGRTPVLCRELVRTLRSDHRHDGTAAACQLGFEYRPAVDTMSRLLDWLRQIDKIR